MPTHPNKTLAIFKLGEATGTLHKAADLVEHAMKAAENPEPYATFKREILSIAKMMAAYGYSTPFNETEEQKND